MPQAQADPDEMERFARTLKQFASDLGNRSSALKQQFGQLGSTWRDQEYTRYAQEFQQTTAMLERIMRKTEAEAAFLQKKANVLRQFLNQR